jgi:hypothetical protein
MSQIRELLKNTEFENLIQNFELNGHSNYAHFAKLMKEGDLINYLKKFENDELKVYKLAEIIKSGVDKWKTKNSNVIMFGVLFGIMIGLLLFQYFHKIDNVEENDEPPAHSEIMSVEKAKERVDWAILENVEYFNQLCSLPKNDNTKLKFLEFSKDLQIINKTYGSLYINLNYDEQREVTEYAMSKLESNPDLKELKESFTITCW